jgi:Ohr subfamily peroxiredoxin
MRRIPFDLPPGGARPAQPATQPPGKEMTMTLEKVLYTAHATSTGGREGRTRSSDGALEVRLSVPKEMNGAGGPGTNPEQLFAAGYSACFLASIKVVAAEQKIRVPADVSIAASVGLGPIASGLGIQAALNISLPGMDREVAQRLVQAAHQVCPYSNATRGNIDVALNLV